MDLLFKLSNTGGKAATIANSNFREHYASINTNMAWATIEPSIRRATERNLIPYISKELYNDLASKYQAGDELTDEQAEAIYLCQDVVAYYAVLSAASELNVGISDMGIVEKGSSQAPVLPVAQWRYKEFKYELTKKADEALDRLLQKLESFVIADKEEFDLWKNSSAYIETRTAFFSSAASFDAFVRIGKSRRLFQELAVDISSVEEEIDHIVCSDQFNELVNLIKEGDGDELQLQLIHKIRRYVSAKAITLCMPRLFLTLDGRGLSLSSYSDGMDNHNHLSSSFRGAEAVNGYVQQLRQNADIYFKDLMAFIYDNIDDFPLFKNSDCYTDANAAGKYPICTGPGGVFL